MIGPNYVRAIDIILLCNVWSGSCSEHKTVSFHWITPVSLMVSLWSQRVSAHSQRCDEIILPRFGWGRASGLAQVWQSSSKSCLHHLVTRRHLDSQMRASPNPNSRSFICVTVYLVFLCLTLKEKSILVLMVCSLSLQPNPLQFCFYSKLLCALITFSPYVCEGPSSPESHYRLPASRCSLFLPNATW